MELKRNTISQIDYVILINMCNAFWPDCRSFVMADLFASTSGPDGPECVRIPLLGKSLYTESYQQRALKSGAAAK